MRHSAVLGHPAANPWFERPAVSASQRKITVLLSREEFARFDEFCREHGFKKSTLLARLLREFLQREAIEKEGSLPLFDQADRRRQR